MKIGYKIFEVKNNLTNLKNKFKTYYKIGENGNWQEGMGKIPVFDHDIIQENLSDEDNTVTVYAKIFDDNNNMIMTEEKCNVKDSENIVSIESDSLLKAINENELKSGKYNVTVNDETYNLKVYSFDENLNVISNMILGTEEDVSNGTDDAKNMIVLKVNGDLTIDEGVILTAYASKNGYGGPKGMLIYCTGNLINNGTISMTARGAYADGQNVYLWKNTDNSYEYIPAVGENGGIPARTGDVITAGVYGNDGTNGSNRKTGGGGSGAAQEAWSTSGSGGSGTSFSGGSGGGSSEERRTAGSGSSKGGPGGYPGGRFGVAYGAGNPGENADSNGTGGLLIIKANNIRWSWNYNLMWLKRWI